MAASAWSLPPMVTKQTSSRTMVTFSTTPKAPKMNSTPRSLNSPGRPQTDSLAALILGGACGRPELGGLVSWSMFRFSRGTRIQHTSTTASLASLGVVKHCGNVGRAILTRCCHWRPCSFLDCPRSAVCLPYEYPQDEREPQTLDLLLVSSQMSVAWLIFKEKAGRSYSAL